MVYPEYARERNGRISGKPKFRRVRNACIFQKLNLRKKPGEITKQLQTRPDFRNPNIAAPRLHPDSVTGIFFGLWRGEGLGGCAWMGYNEQKLSRPNGALADGECVSCLGDEAP